MDSIDAKIVNILQQDGRISMNRLAAEIPMSVPAACARVHKLEDSGVIRSYSAKISFHAVGRTINAYVLLACNIGEIDKVRTIIEDDSRVAFACFLAGKFTMMLRLACRDMEDYMDFVKKIMPLGTSETYIMLEHIKEDYCELDEADF